MAGDDDARPREHGGGGAPPPQVTAGHAATEATTPLPSAPAPRGRIGILRPLHLRDFRLLWTAMTVSLLGDGIFTVALAWQVYELSNVPTALSLVGVAWSLPLVAFLLVGGVASDRFDRRKLMIASDVVRAIVIAAMGLLSVTGRLELWHMAVLAVGFGAGEAFFAPAFNAIVPQVVPNHLLVEANSLDQFVRPAAFYMFGPALGGWLIEGFGAGYAFLADAATFGASAIAIAAMRPTARTRAGDGSPIAQLRDGFRFVRSQTWLWATLMSAAIALLLMWGPFQVLVPYLVKNILGGSANDLGFVFAVGGVGALLASFVMGQVRLPRKHMVFMYVVWAVSVGAMVLYGVARALPVVFAARFITGALATAGMVVWGTMMHRLVPDELLGRVTSVDWLVSLGLVPVSFAIAGPISQSIGVPATFILSGVLGSSITIAFLLVPGIRDTERDGRMHETAAAAAPATSP